MHPARAVCLISCSCCPEPVGWPGSHVQGRALRRVGRHVRRRAWLAAHRLWELRQGESGPSPSRNRSRTPKPELCKVYLATNVRTGERMATKVLNAQAISVIVDEGVALRLQIQNRRRQRTQPTAMVPHQATALTECCGWWSRCCLTRRCLQATGVRCDGGGRVRAVPRAAGPYCCAVQHCPMSLSTHVSIQPCLQSASCTSPVAHPCCRSRSSSWPRPSRCCACSTPMWCVSHALPTPILG